MPSAIGWTVDEAADADGGRLNGFAPPSFRERPPWWGPDLQTLRNYLLIRARGRPSAPPGESRMMLAMDDGSGDELVAVLNRPAEDAGPARPLVILAHGLTGCEFSTYMLASTKAFLAAGYPVLRLNLRGAGPSRRTCSKNYHAGRSADLRAVLAGLDPALTDAGVFMVGYSLGGNALLKFLGEEGAAATRRVVGAATISAPIDLAAASACMGSPRNRLYHRYLLPRMKREAQAPGSGVTEAERRAINAAETIAELDDTFIAPHNGFADADDYYNRSAAFGFMPAVRVPVLVVHALNDPWIPRDAYDRYDWSGNACLTPLLARRGGHVGFHGAGDERAWHDRAMIGFLNALLR